MNELDQAVERLSEAMQDSTLLVAAYLKRTGKARATACKEVADRAGMPELWRALESRVIRLQQKSTSEQDSDIAMSGWQKGSIRGAKSGIRKHPELAKELLTDPEVVEAVTSAIANDPSATAQVAAKVEAKRPRTKSSAGTDRGLVGVTGLAALLDGLDNAVLFIEERLPEFTAALRDNTVPNGDGIAEEWQTKLTIAAQMLELATVETL